MENKLLTREAVRAAIHAAVEPLPYVLAAWEAGAAAFQRADEWSDLDVQLIVEDDHVAEAARIVEQALANLGGIDLKYEIPQPSWHGHFQAFYRLKNASPFLLIDFVAMKRSTPNQFLQNETHGRPLIYFDRANLLQSPPFDEAGHRQKLQARVESLRILFPLFQPFVLKEIHRGNPVEALMYYHSSTLRPLLELLRIRYCPQRYNFNTRYFYYDLPAEVIREVEPLFFVTDSADIHAKRLRAEKLFDATLAALTI